MPMSVEYLKWLPVVDEDLCTGCAACVEACGPKSLEILDRVAVQDRIEPGAAVRRQSPSAVRPNQPGCVSVNTPTLLKSRSTR